MNDLFWRERAAECAEARREVERLKEALRVQRSDRLLDLIARLATELERRQFGYDFGCESCIGGSDYHDADCPLRLALDEAAALAPNTDDSLG